MDNLIKILIPLAKQYIGATGIIVIMLAGSLICNFHQYSLITIQRNHIKILKDELNLMEKRLEIIQKRPHAPP